MIYSKRVEIAKPKRGDSLLKYIESKLKKTVDGNILRFAVVDVTGSKLVIDVSFVKE